MRFLFFSVFVVACSEYDIKSTVDPNDEIEEIVETLEEESASAPIAVCQVSSPEISPPFESASFDGSESYDPSGGQIVSYLWELVSAPNGNSVSLSYTDQAIVPGFTPELAGQYVAQLTVTNEVGMTDTCDIALEAVPAENLWVEMYWTYSNDDMDLHMIAPNYDWQSYWNSDKDCYYSNCVANSWFPLDWGTTGYVGDDPVLDLDDIPGVGPENINVLDPEDSGLYTVVVHDYPGSVYDLENNVTINIYLDGSLAWTDTRSISGEDTCTVFAQVDWGAGAIVPINQGSIACPASSWF